MKPSISRFTVIADMARNVGGHLAEVRSITPPGAEIHDYQPSPRDIIGIADADLVLVNGLNLDGWAQQYLDRAGDVPIIAVSDGIDPLPIRSGDYEGKPNPHAWMALDSCRPTWSSSSVSAKGSWVWPSSAWPHADKAWW